MKRLIFVCLLVLGCLGSVTTVIAGPNFCSKATVVKTGVASTGQVVYLRNDQGVPVGVDDSWPAGATKSFILHSSITDSGLATALTALSLGKPVLAGSPDNKYPDWGYISYIYLNN